MIGLIRKRLGKIWRLEVTRKMICKDLVLIQGYQHLIGYFPPHIVEIVANRFFKNHFINIYFRKVLPCYAFIHIVFLYGTFWALLHLMLHKISTTFRWKYFNSILLFSFVCDKVPWKSPLMKNVDKPITHPHPSPSLT